MYDKYFKTEAAEEENEKINEENINQSKILPFEDDNELFVAGSIMLIIVALVIIFLNMI